ncbi:hypothetical protein, partial [Paenibacillus sp. Marseille-Q4541]|uniref:hypothetical protein n=1 Tax=Paenibacillus sp. Marseille-Q4541 TaxID=2831522 RepID=UPI001BA63A75
MDKVPFLVLFLVIWGMLLLFNKLLIPIDEVAEEEAREKLPRYVRILDIIVVIIFVSMGAAFQLLPDISESIYLYFPLFAVPYGYFSFRELKYSKSVGRYKHSLI